MEVAESRGTGTLLYLQTNQTSRQKEVLMAVREAELVMVRHGETASNRSHIIHCTVM